MTYKTALAAVLWLVAHGGLAAPAQALDDPANGKRIAERWCSACHLVAPGQAVATVAAPPFASIAERSSKELDKLETFLADPHPVMPNLSLTRREIADLVAHIRSLRP